MKVAAFDWTGIDEAGRQRSGRLSATSEAEARARLERRKMFVTALAPGDGPAPGTLLSRAPRLSTGALALFTRQFATLLGVTPVDEALETIARQSERPATRKVVDNVRTAISGGSRLSDAMAQEPGSFDPLYRAIVAAGDNAGRLPMALERLALLIERQAETRNKVMGTLAYPAVLALVAILVVNALMIFVVPRMVEQFDQAGAQLPWLTRAVMALSAFMASWWWLMALLMLALGIGLWLALRDEGRRLAFDRWRLGWPLLGRMTRDLHAARFARTLSTMVAARLPLIEGLALARDTVRNRAQSAALAAVIADVRAGGSLAGAMQATGLFPPLLVYLTASGESAGQLETTLDRAADTLEREFDGTTAVALALLEPLVIVMMGVVVALIILSVLLPILQLESLAAL